MKSNGKNEQGDSALQKFLETRRGAESKANIPPTTTESLFMTILYGKEPSQKQPAKVMRSSQRSASAPCTSEPKVPKRTVGPEIKQPDVKGGLWSKLALQGTKLEKVRNEVPTANKALKENMNVKQRKSLTLDDIVGHGEVSTTVSENDGHHSKNYLSNVNRRKRNFNKVFTSVWSTNQTDLGSFSSKNDFRVHPEDASTSTIMRTLPEQDCSRGRDDQSIPKDACIVKSVLKSCQSKEIVKLDSSIVHTSSDLNIDPTTGPSSALLQKPFPHDPHRPEKGLRILDECAQDASRVVTAVEVPAPIDRVNESVKESSLDDAGPFKPHLENVTVNHSKDSSLIHSHKPTRFSNKDNFVRLNLRNRAGACRGAKNLRQHNRQKRRRIQESQDRQSSDHISSDYEIIQGSNRRNISLQTVMDPIDDFLDGTFHHTSTDDVPVCTRHNLPCKLVTVKKASSVNKGRRFYACPMPQYDACNFFQWEDDTIQAAQLAITKERNVPCAFVERQIHAYESRWKVLSVPELRVEAKRRSLTTSGDKESLVNRLVDWAAAQLKQALNQDASVPAEEDFCSNRCPKPESVANNDYDSESDDDSSTEELELIVSEDLALDCKDTTTQPSRGLSSRLHHDDFPSQDSTKNLQLPSRPNLTDSNSPSRKYEISKTHLRSHLKEYFGFSEFRDGQEWAVKRCLDKKRSLFVAPTGLGKSLCYALPAALMDGICIVVSPLISLMEDQLRRLHPSITASSLSGNLSSAQMALAMEDLVNKRLKILFISPERLLSPAFRRLLRPKFNNMTNTYDRQLPTVSLLCIDEAHCMSQWGHNFRPSYLRLQYLLKSLQPKSILALTATAGPPVIRDICHALNINNSIDDDGVAVIKSDRNNIEVSAHFVTDEIERLTLLTLILRDSQRSTSLAHRYHSSVLGCLSSGSVIIYVWRKKDAEYIFEQLSSYDDLGKVVCYHGGMSHSDRATSQNKFMRGKARICVATVAFGMGIDKADVSGVIHMFLPSSPENFVQEIGRAGRSGQRAKAIAIITPNDFIIKHSLSHTETLSKSQIRGLLKCLQMCIAEAKDENQCGLNVPEFLDIGVNISALVEAIDVKEESIMTVLAYLESDILASSKSLLSIEGLYPDRATVVLKRKKIDSLVVQEPIFHTIQKCGARVDLSLIDCSINADMHRNGFAVSCGTALDMGFASYGFGTYHFSVLKCARMRHMEPRHIYAALRRFEKSGDIELKFDSKENFLHLQINSEGLHKFDCGLDNADDILGVFAESLSNIFSCHDKVRVSKVESMYDIMYRIDAKGRKTIESSGTSQQLDGLPSSAAIPFYQLINDYFNREHETVAASGDQDSSCSWIRTFPYDDLNLISQLSLDILSLVSNPSSLRRSSSSTYGVEFGVKYFEDYTTVVVTKILHGIETPRHQSPDWFSHPLWAKYRTYKFESLMTAVSSVIGQWSHERDGNQKLP